MRPVGILGGMAPGMGPEATILLMQKLRAAVPEARDSDRLPVARTELSLMTDTLSGLTWSDGLDCLTSAIVDFARAAG